MFATTRHELLPIVPVMTFRHPRGIARVVLFLAGALALSACSNLSRTLRDGESTGPPSGAFKPVQKAAHAPLLSREDLALIEESTTPIYRLGAGDVVRLDVYGRPDVSGKHVVGPDGTITVPLVGDVIVGELTREAAVQTLTGRLRVYFSQPHATLAVEEYTSNQVTVLGRVERAGPQKFAHPPTLAEVLANAGALPTIDKQATLTRCAIMRGREKMIWVDLKALLNGDPGYNLRMKKGDIVFIPDSADTSVYVLGAVTKPGSYRLTPRMTVLDALSQAGGPSENAEATRIGIYRPAAGQVEVIDLAALIDPARRPNYALEDGDVIFVPNSAMADFGYIVRQIAPAMSILTFGIGLNQALGL